MRLSLDMAWVHTAFLLSLRLAGLFAATPIFGALGIPRMIRVLFVIAFSIALTAISPRWHSPPNGEIGALLFAGVSELALGATMALGILIAFAAFSIAGRILDVQIGYGIAQVFDPLSRRNMPILMTAFNQLAVIAFFMLNGHHMLMRGLAYSLERYPLGYAWPITGAAEAIVKEVASMFVLGFALVSPVVFCLFLVELGLAILARNLPQFNMFAMGIPVKIVVGLIVLSLWITGAGSVMEKAYASIFTAWEGILK